MRRRSNMSFNPNALATSPIQRVRLLVGDVLDFPLLEDSVYQYLILKNDSVEIDAAIEACENIINMLVFNPTDEDIGQVGQKTRSVSDFRNILQNLKDQKFLDANKTKRIPMMVRSDRKDWSDFDKLYGRD